MSKTKFGLLAGVFICTPLVGGIQTATAASPPPLDPLTIPKYVTPLVIPPVMNNTGTANDYDIAVRQFQQQILPGGIWATLPGCTGQPCDFPATKVWSYGPDADPTPVVAPDPASQFNYPAYTVENTVNATTTVDWMNQLVKDPDQCKLTPNTGACNFLRHITPIDRSLHWANPEQRTCEDGTNTKDCRPTPSNADLDENGIIRVGAWVKDGDPATGLQGSGADRDPCSRRPRRPRKRRLSGSLVAARCQQHPGRLCDHGHPGQPVRRTDQQCTGCSQLHLSQHPAIYHAVVPRPYAGHDPQQRLRGSCRLLADS